MPKIQQQLGLQPRPRHRNYNHAFTELLSAGERKTTYQIQLHFLLFRRVVSMLTATHCASVWHNYFISADELRPSF